MNDKVFVFKDSSGDWRWHRKAGNNEIIATSGEGYEDQTHCLIMARKLNPDVPVLYADGEPSEGD